MSWSVTATGTIDQVIVELDRQFVYPLAAAPGGLSDPGEKETVRLIRDTIWRTLKIFDPAKHVAVAAYGHISFDDYETKTGASQTVSLTIQPVATQMGLPVKTAG